ncbi:branched-chain amino acid ABC transporter permease [Kitasatospora sp. DSM 101779]|uniref:branched-chain amino acid ABC transporter permease n=1 Tax=Kitasatospora sp. DSM 101779 TaxID=2853165 RepID=UPI0021D839D5|nr:branched-chain amino acid ABC transporter permease [Kitasatospora sp. DSM 101779]MCU7822095.1 branched-chain amino acid ABC transporter permease [Kitasatospora sp. DSM 101779]
MTRLAETLLDALALGSVYALVALGFTVVFKASGVMNFAHGSVLLLGGWVVAATHGAVGFPLAVLLGAAAAAAASGLLHLLTARGLRGAGAHAATILTIGADLALLTALGRAIGADYLATGDPWGSAVVRIGGVHVVEARLAGIAVSVALIGAVFAAFRWTRWGLAMRAASADEEAAALMGVRLGRMRLTAWCTAGALAAVAAVFLAAFPSPGLDRSTGQLALAAFPAAVLGGLDSAAGALVGSLAIGLAGALAAGYQDELGAFGEGLPGIAPYLVMVAVLLVRPSGLLGSKEAVRV